MYHEAGGGGYVDLFCADVYDGAPATTLLTFIDLKGHGLVFGERTSFCLRLEGILLLSGFLKYGAL